MSVAELKGVLHEGIENVQDERLLSLIKEMIEQQYKPESTLTLNSERIRQLNIARAENQAGQTISSKDSDREVDTWLNR